MLLFLRKAKFIIDQENQILFRLLDTFYSLYPHFIYCPRKNSESLSLHFFFVLLLLANENTDESIPINLAKAKARSKSVSVSTWVAKFASETSFNAFNQS
jgi:hypothetical protein